MTLFRTWQQSDNGLLFKATHQQLKNKSKKLSYLFLYTYTQTIASPRNNKERGLEPMRTISWGLLKSIVIGGVLFGLSSSLLAFDFDNKLKVNGFGTLGVVYNNDENADFIRKKNQPDVKGGEVTYSQDSRLGLQLSYNPTPKLKFTIQAVSRYDHDESFSPKISWAYAHYVTNNWTIRAGRLGADNFFRADSLDVGYGFLWARPPPDYYAGNINSQYDGLDVTRTFYTNWGVVDVKAYGGKFDDSFYANETLSLDVSDTYVTGLIAGVEIDNLLLRAQYSHFDVRSITFDIPALRQIYPPLAHFTLPAKSSDYYVFGLSYDIRQWRLQAGINIYKQNGNLGTDSVANYLSVGYRYRSWTPYALLSSNTPHTTPTSPLLPIPLPDSLNLVAPVTDQYSIAVGARLDVAQNVALKAQIEQIESKTSNSFSWVNKDNWDKDATVFSIVLDFVF